jgi:uncharacterized protein YigE (DUF2233 family)
MFRKILLFFIFHFSFFIFSFAQTRGYSSVPFAGTTFRAFTIKIDTYSVNRFELLQNTSDANHANMVRMAKSRYGSCFLINGAVAETGCAFIGLAINQGTEISPLNLGNGNGAFFMKPNGVLSIDEKGAEIVESTNYKNSPTKKLALQSGPMLLINGRIHPEFRDNSTNRFYRSGVGLFTKNGETFLVFAVSNEPVNLYTAATFFKDKFGCNNALSLQSSATAADIPFMNANPAADNQKFCSYIVFKE